MEKGKKMNINKLTISIVSTFGLVLGVILGLYGFEFLGKGIIDAMDSQVKDYYEVGIKVSFFYYLSAIAIILLTLKIKRINLKQVQQ
jgi:Mg2+ and Co2+ transporter CorA